jgi:urease subunit alpha
VLWKPAFFGVKPSTIIKGGMIAAAPMGDPNASIPTPQPVHYRMMFGAFGGGLKKSFTFVSQSAYDDGIGDLLKLNKTLIVAKNMRSLRKSDMIHNGLAPKMDVNPETYEVRANGELLVCEAASVLPMAQRYFLF